jgi:putative NADH-flavin reductase
MKLAILGASGSVGREIAVEEEQRAIAYVEESLEISESWGGV